MNQLTNAFGEGLIVVGISLSILYMIFNSCSNMNNDRFRISPIRVTNYSEKGSYLIGDYDIQDKVDKFKEKYGHYCFRRTYQPVIGPYVYSFATKHIEKVKSFFGIEYD